eukprot:11163182-Lingulodinium_polyedra.AAC.1
MLALDQKQPAMHGKRATLERRVQNTGGPRGIRLRCRPKGLGRAVGECANLPRTRASNARDR